MRKNGSAPGRLIWQLSLVFGCLLAVTLVMVACSSMSGTPSTSGMGKVTVSISDPATCQASGGGPFQAVYVTITDVQANISSTSDSGWTDLTPNLSKAPMQINLLGQANNQCFLAMLGDALELQAGSYQQIRLILATTVTEANNPCGGNAANCVIVTDPTTNTNQTYTLQLSSEAQTGIKIPSSQITGGAFPIQAGQTADLDINFQTCDSIVREGNGQYRLKPVLHAGEVEATQSSINGTVIDAATGNPSTGKVEVALEQPGAPDTIVMTTLTDFSGNFVFCPVPAGTYDVVVVGVDGNSNFYQPAIVTGVSVGSTTGTLQTSPIKLHLPSSNGNAQLTALITSTDTTTPTPKGISIDATLTVFETLGGTTYTIPLPPFMSQSSGTLTVVTGSTPPAPTLLATCPTGTDCAQPTLDLPAGGAFVYPWTSSGPGTPTTNGTGAYATYVLDAQTSHTCKATDLKTNALALTSATTYPASITTAGAVAPATTTLDFTGCQ